MNKGDKKKQSLLQQQMQQQQAQFGQYLQQASQPSALQSAWDARNQGILDWESGKNGPVDVMKMPGINPYLDLYNRAKAGEEEDQIMGKGMYALGGAGSANPEYMAMLNAQMRERRQQRAAGALENSVNSLLREAHGAVMPSASLSQSRTMGFASLTGGAADAATGRYASFTPRPGFFNQLGSSFANSLGGFLGGGAKYKGWSFERGGNLSRYMRKPGDRALVGETGPEAAEVDENGDIQITPLTKPGGQPPRVYRGEGAGPMTLDDLFALNESLNQRGRKQAPPPVVTDVASIPPPAMRPRTVAPQEPMPRPVAALLAAASNRDEPVEQVAGPYATAAPVASPTQGVPYVGVVGLDVDPRTAGMGERPRVANPLEFAGERLKQGLVAPSPVDRNGRGRSALAGAWEGFKHGGLVGAMLGTARGVIDPSSDERDAQAAMQARDRNLYAQLYAQRQGELGLEGAEADVRNKRWKPALEWEKYQAAERHRRQTEAVRLLGTLKGQNVDPANPAHARIIQQLEDAGVPFDPVAFNNSASNLAGFDLIDPDSPTQKRRVYYNKATGQLDEVGASGYVQPVGENGMTAYQTGSLYLGGQRFGEAQRHNQVTEGLAREGLRLREYLGQGALDARWAGIEQGYDRLDAGRQKQVDDLAGKAAKAEDEATYFDALASGEADEAKKGQAVASAALKRRQAASFRSQAETITSRPAPRVATPRTSGRRGPGPLGLFSQAPPVTENEYVEHGRKTIPNFDEQRAREAYRKRYGSTGH